jgi:hypothetical protein
MKCELIMWVNGATGSMQRMHQTLNISSNKDILLYTGSNKYMQNGVTVKIITLKLYKMRYNVYLSLLHIFHGNY